MRPIIRSIVGDINGGSKKLCADATGQTIRISNNSARDIKLSPIYGGVIDEYNEFCTTAVDSDLHSTRNSNYRSCNYTHTTNTFSRKHQL